MIMSVCDYFSLKLYSFEIIFVCDYIREKDYCEICVEDYCTGGD